MLNIPKSIKDRFKSDNALKNIRISFPNGERADICNDRLIKESLKFDESISSREEIKFGLCESSQISFECVGVENIKNMEIAVDIELDATGIEPIDEYRCLTGIPLYFVVKPTGEEHNLFIFVSDFPEREAEADDYVSQDGTRITWKYPAVQEGETAKIKNKYTNDGLDVDVYHEAFGLDPRGTYEDMYDGYHGGGYEYTYLYSVTTGKFYKCVRNDYLPWGDIDMEAVLADGFTNSDWLDALGQITFDTRKHAYIWNWGSDIHTRSDVPFPFYTVPLGHFIVNECKRNSGTMSRRKVVAYSRESDLKSYDWWTEMNWWTVGNFDFQKVDFDIINFVAATTPQLFDTSDRESVTFTRSGDNFTLNFSLTGSDRNTYNFKLEVYGCWYADIYDRTAQSGHLIESLPWPSTEYLGIVEKCVISSHYEDSIADAITGFEAQNVPTDVITKLINIISHFRPFNVLNAYRNPDLFNTTTYSDPYYADYEPMFMQKGKELKEGDLFIMPWKLALYSQILVTNMSGYASTSFRIWLSDAGLTIGNVLKISKVNILDGYRLTIPIYPDIKRATSGSSYIKSFLLDILPLDMRKLLEGNVEVMGCFGRAGRNGRLQLLTIHDIELNGLFPNHELFPNENLFPVSFTDITTDEANLAVIKSDCMMDLWYEEYCIKFGGLTLTYMSSEILDESNEPTEVNYDTQWDNSENALIYDLSDNEYIKAKTWTNAQIEALVAPLVQALQYIKFYPSDLKCVGLPYIEAGDWTLATYQGNTVLGLVLSRTLDGIQAMRDKMKSD